MNHHAPVRPGYLGPHWSGRQWSRELSRELQQQWMAQWAGEGSGRPARSGQVRIGDAERDEAVSALGEHFAAGRITKDEFDERSDQATQARYADDLVPLFADLPDTVAPQQHPRQGRRRPGPPPFVWVLPFLMVATVVMAFAMAAPWLLWFLFCLFMIGRVGRWHRRY